VRTWHGACCCGCCGSAPLKRNQTSGTRGECVQGGARGRGLVCVPRSACRRPGVLDAVPPPPHTHTKLMAILIPAHTPHARTPTA
jgi:hypothetical protein